MDGNNFFKLHIITSRASLVAQTVKSLPVEWETQVRTLGQEDPLEKEMATHSSIPAWRIPWTVEPDRLQLVGSQRVGHNWVTSLSFWASLVAQLVKNPSAMWETWFRSLGWEDPLVKGPATHSSILAWRIPWTIQPMVSQRVRHDWATFTNNF